MRNVKFNFILSAQDFQILPGVVDGYFRSSLFINEPTNTLEGFP